MALSEAEWKRRQEEEDAEPHYFGMTWGEFRRLPERQQQETRQRLTQLGATHVGFWKDCTLGKCRRARRCIGFLSEAQYRAGYNAAYPPCARGEEPRRAKIYYDGICRLFPEGDEEPKYDGRRKTGEGDE